MAIPTIKVIGTANTASLKRGETANLPEPEAQKLISGGWASAVVKEVTVAPSKKKDEPKRIPQEVVTRPDPKPDAKVSTKPKPKAKAPATPEEAKAAKVAKAKEAEEIEIEEIKIEETEK